MRLKLPPEIDTLRETNIDQMGQAFRRLNVQPSCQWLFVAQTKPSYVCQYTLWVMATLTLDESEIHPGPNYTTLHIFLSRSTFHASAVKDYVIRRLYEWVSAYSKYVYVTCRHLSAIALGGCIRLLIGAK